MNVELQHLQPETLIPINSTPKQVCTTTSDSVQQSCPAQDGSAAGASIIPNAGVFTREEVTAGDVMAAIPVNLGYEINPGTERLVSDCCSSDSGNERGGWTVGAPVHCRWVLWR